MKRLILAGGLAAIIAALITASRIGSNKSGHTHRQHQRGSIIRLAMPFRAYSANRSPECDQASR